MIKDQDASKLAASPRSTRVTRPANDGGIEGHHTVDVDADADMRAYDRLDPRLQKIVRDAPLRFSAATMARLLKDCGGDVGKTVARAERNLVKFVREKTEEAYGPDHPES
jgi:hypothetical protein